MTTMITGFDQERADAFVGTALSEVAGFGNVVMAYLGDRLGLFTALAPAGPVTSAELAERTGLQERYVREWLAAMAHAQYLDYDPPTRRFSLAAEHAPVLAQEGGPVFFGGVIQELVGLAKTVDLVATAFRAGGGVAAGDFAEDVWTGMSRFTANWHDNLLVQVWIPLLPEVRARLEAGAELADVGCGRGRGLIRLAQEFPRSRFVGYDVYGPNVEIAATEAERAGVSDRVRFEVLDAAAGLPDRFDVVTTFDVVHDSVDPLGLLRSIRNSLHPDGVYVCLDINCSARLEDDHGPIGAVLGACSVLHCLTISLAGGGAGLGTLGLPESTLTELATTAGFATVRKVDMDNPFNNLYQLRP